ncbi:hypothetical protein GOBAR_AA39578 [Gossypium barbadense]|uniref:DNA-directed RNA polymerase insert domain-containing protein n=1 Tax=Gossypium barbadense TaxID=3634 RepID=A0A2P5VQL8_GOSBA|nr:hypothetical protein GOBAR_AA39578 [Gossypium barbadense]
MLGDENEEMSTIPRLNQIQFEGFCGFMDRGLTEELYKFPKIEDREILMNLKEIVLRGNLYGTRNAFICAKGPGYVTAQDIILPPSVEIVDNTQHVASLTEPIDLCIGLQIERNRGYVQFNARALFEAYFDDQKAVTTLSKDGIKSTLAKGIVLYAPTKRKALSRYYVGVAYSY